jgi:hypothetical protein
MPFNQRQAKKCEKFPENFCGFGLECTYRTIASAAKVEFAPFPQFPCRRKSASLFFRLLFIVF